ncbi:MAG: hypothetical protein V4591_09090 [Bdellovibrionota bacterium]
MDFYCDEKIHGDKLILAYIHFDDRSIDEIIYFLKNLHKENKIFRFHASEDMGDKKTRRDAIRLKNYIENNISRLCHEKKIVYSSKQFLREIDAYKWVSQEMLKLNSDVLHRDEGKFKKDEENKIKNFFHQKKIKIISHKKDQTAKNAQMIGVVDYILHFDIKLYNSTRKTKRP